MGAPALIHFLAFNQDRAKPRYVAADGRALANRDGAEWLVVPITSIVPGVLPGSRGPLYYPPEEVARNHRDWDDVPLTLFHPLNNGRPSSIRDGDAHQNHGIGVIKRSAFNGKLQHEGWVNLKNCAAAERRFGVNVLAGLEKGEPFETSTGLYTDDEPATPGAHHNGRAYDFVARRYRPDHIALLPGQQGACSLRDGCGINVNAAREEIVDGLDAAKLNVGDRWEIIQVNSRPKFKITRNDHAIEGTGCMKCGETFEGRKCPKCGTIKIGVTGNSLTPAQAAVVLAAAEVVVNDFTPEPHQDDPRFQHAGTPQADAKPSGGGTTGGIAAKCPSCGADWEPTGEHGQCKECGYVKGKKTAEGASSNDEPDAGEETESVRINASKPSVPTATTETPGAAPNGEPKSTKCNTCGAEMQGGKCPKCNCSGTMNAKKSAWRKLGEYLGILNKSSNDVDGEKACQILRDGEVRGHELTEAQRGMFGAACGDSKKDNALGLIELPSPFIEVPGLNVRDWPTYNRDWPQSKRDKHPAEDFAGPDQSFPISTQADVDAAAHLIGKAANPDAVRAKIKAIAKRKGLKTPDTWNAWSDEARAAALEARRANSKGAVAVKASQHAESMSGLAGSKVDNLNGARDEARGHAGSALSAAGKGDSRVALYHHMHASERHYALATHPDHVGTAFAQHHMLAMRAHDEAAAAHRANTDRGGRIKTTNQLIELPVSLTENAMPLTKEQRAAAVDGLVTNCGFCANNQEVAARYRAFVTDLPDDQIVAMVNTHNAMKLNELVANSVKEGIDVGDGKKAKWDAEQRKFIVGNFEDGDPPSADEDDASEVHARTVETELGKGKKGKKAPGSMATTKNAGETVQQYLDRTDAPPMVRTALTNAVAFNERQKQALIERLVSNVAKEQRDAKRKFLANKEYEELVELSHLIPTSNQQRVPDGMPAFLLNGGPYGNAIPPLPPAPETEDVLELPTVNFAEWAEEDRKRKATA